MKKFLVIIMLFAVCALAQAKLFDKVALKVNDKIVTQRDFDKYLAFMKATAGVDDKNVVKRQLISILLLEYYSEEVNLDITRKDVTREILDIAERMKLPDEEKLRVFLSEKIGVELTSEDLHDLMKKRILVEKAQRHVIMNNKRESFKRPTEEAMQALYNKARNNFVAPLEISLAHLVKVLPQNAGFTETLQIEKSMVELRAKLMKIKNKEKRQELFFQLVQKEAAPIYKNNNGMLGSFDQQKLMGLFPHYAPVAQLKDGEVSNVLASGSSRALVMVLDRKGGEVLPYGEVRDRIEQILMMQEGQKHFEEWLSEYKEKFTIVEDL